MSSYMRVWSINITGNSLVSGQALHHLSDIHYGLHSWSLELEEAEQAVEAFKEHVQEKIKLLTDELEGEQHKHNTTLQ